MSTPPANSVDDDQKASERGEPTPATMMKGITAFKGVTSSLAAQEQSSADDAETGNTTLKQVANLAIEMSKSLNEQSEKLSPLDSYIRDKAAVDRGGEKKPTKSEQPQASSVPTVMAVADSSAVTATVKRDVAPATITTKQPRLKASNNFADILGTSFTAGGVGYGGSSGYTQKVTDPAVAKDVSLQAVMPTPAIINKNPAVNGMTMSPFVDAQVDVKKMVGAGSHPVVPVVKEADKAADKAMDGGFSDTIALHRWPIKRRKELRNPDMVHGVLSGQMSQGANLVPMQAVIPTTEPKAPKVDIATSRESLPVMEKKGLAVVGKEENSQIQSQSNRVKTVIALAKATIQRKQAMRKSDRLFSALTNNEAKEAKDGNDKFVLTKWGQDDLAVAKNSPAKVDAVHSSVAELQNSVWQPVPMTYEARIERKKESVWTPTKFSYRPLAENKQQGTAGLPANKLADFVVQNTKGVQRDMQAGKDAGRAVVNAKRSADLESYWEVPVETLGVGVLQLLGNTVGGVVHIGKRVAGKGRGSPSVAYRAGSADRHIKSEIKTLKRGQQMKTVMAGRVGGGVRGVVSGVGQIAKGGVNIVVGSLGCLGGALVCISGIKINNKAPRKVAGLHEVERV